MNGDNLSGSAEVVMLENGSLRCGDVVHEPWPSLRIHPVRSLGHHDEIIRAMPGSPFFEFANRIPPEIRALVRAAPCFQWSLLELCAADPESGFELLNNIPALAVLIARNYSPTDHRDRREYFRAMLAKPWRDLLREFKLPPHRRTMRILRKVSLDHCYRNSIDKFRTVLGTPGHPWVHVLPHLPRITRDTISLLSADAKVLNASLLRASSETDYEVETVHWLIGSVRVLLIENGREGDWPYRCATFEQLKIAEGRLQDRLYAESLAPFPSPPIRGCPGEIEPLRDFDRLLLEGTIQKNCATTYIQEIARGLAYVYAVYFPERATVALRRDAPDGEWYLHDIRALNNSEVNAATNLHVQEWLCSGSSNRQDEKSRTN